MYIKRVKRVRFDSARAVKTINYTCVYNFRLRFMYVSFFPSACIIIMIQYIYTIPHAIDGNSTFCFHKNIIVVQATRSEPASISRRHVHTYMYIISCAVSYVLLGYFLTITSVARMYLYKFSVSISSVTVPSPSLWPVICLLKSTKKNLKRVFHAHSHYTLLYQYTTKKNSTCNIAQTMFAIYLFFLRLKLYCFSNRFNAWASDFSYKFKFKKKIKFLYKISN